MSLSARARQFALPQLAAVAVATGIATSPAFANTPTQISVQGAESGAMRLNNPVSIQGVARDPQGIQEIFGTIQLNSNNKFVTQTGTYSNDPSPLKFKFTNSQATRWASQQFNLPNGAYTFRMRVRDGAQAMSEMVEIPFTVGAAVAAAPAANQRTTQQVASAAPAAAIQFPQNGAVLSQAAAFSGIAKDDQAVVGVIATIMNTATGMFLDPNGNFAPAGQLKLRTIQGKNAQWTTPQVQLPAGNYLLSVKAVDNNGQEGQWAQSKFSVAPQATQTAAVAAAPAAVAAGAKAANGMNYCSSNGMDSDGDGFGWQNNASCVVAGSKADTHPTCASSSSDPDGDGYGWENQKSCIVVTHCASAGSDPDGDGFGWENNRSCVVLQKTNNSRFPTCAAGPASDPDGDGYGWENNATCLVVK